MTPSSVARKKFVSVPSRSPRTTSTFRLQELMEEEQKLRIGERITLLRERSPYGQPQIADKLDIGLRAYQKLEAVGTTKYERCEEIAEIHSSWTKRDPRWKHVNADWIWDGRAAPAETPDVLGALSPNGSAADLKADVDRLLSELDAARLEVLEAISEVHDELAEIRQHLGRGARGRASSGNG